MNALRLARAASDTARSPAVVAEAQLLQARAHAVLGDRTSCVRALIDAERIGAAATAMNDDLSVPIGETIIAGHTARELTNMIQSLNHHASLDFVEQAQAVLGPTTS